MTLGGYWSPSSNVEIANYQNFSFAFARENSPVQPLFVKDPRITGVLFHCVSNSACCQGKVLVFIGDWRATKEPIPVCLATTKSWDWHTGDAITDFTSWRWGSCQNKGSQSSGHPERSSQSPAPTGSGAHATGRSRDNQQVHPE
jgi:hypothetical protein